MPVIINSGSGNQGMTASLPVIVYAKEYNVCEELLYRSLVLSNLCTIHQKTGIGRLSAYCGAVSAGIGAGCGIAYLLGGDYSTVAHTMVNGLAIVSGIVCDGAKPSCAAKIASSVDAGILGYYCCRRWKSVWHEIFWRRPWNFTGRNDGDEIPFEKFCFWVSEEVEVYAICDGKQVFVPGIMELVERTGIHSGDSISVYPTFSISEKVKKFFRNKKTPSA